jgi:hypothetical protein
MDQDRPNPADIQRESGEQDSADTSSLPFATDAHQDHGSPQKMERATPESGPFDHSRNLRGMPYAFLLRHAAMPIPARPVPRRRRDVGSGTGAKGLPSVVIQTPPPPSVWT